MCTLMRATVSQMKGQQYPLIGILKLGDVGDLGGRNQEGLFLEIFAKYRL